MDIEAFNRQMRKYLRKINLKNVQIMNQSLLPLGVTPTQMMLIYHLDHNGRMNISQLSASMEMPKSNISAICGRLEENGLLNRQRDSADQRIVYVTLTEAAERLTKKAKQILDREQNQLAAKLTDSDQQKILEGLSLLEQMYRDDNPTI